MGTGSARLDARTQSKAARALAVHLGWSKIGGEGKQEGKWTGAVLHLNTRRRIWDTFT